MTSELKNKMTEQEIEDLKYPIGKLNLPEVIDAAQIKSWIRNIETLPVLLQEAIDGMTEEQLDTRYRPGGWTARQVVHHLADSHLNSYIRFKWALTEDNPTIKAYDESIWADFDDAKSAPVEVSVALISGLHGRWVTMLKGLSMDDLQRTFYHPGYDRTMQLDRMVGLYAWHGNHHLGHIRNVKEKTN
jgi:hypothetical protein